MAAFAMWVQFQVRRKSIPWIVAIAASGLDAGMDSVSHLAYHRLSEIATTV